MYMRIFSGLPRNPKYCLAFEPIWAITFGMLNYYLPLYMKEVGLSEVQIGIVSSAALFSGCLFVFFAAPLGNKLGRKRTLYITDSISWGLAMFVWAISRNFWLFLIAAVLNSAGKAGFPSWNGLMTEDTPPHLRPKVFAYLNTIITLGAVTAPITAILFDYFNVIPTMSVMYIIGGIVMISVFNIRGKFLCETTAGKEIMERNKHVPISYALMKFIVSIPRVFKNTERLLFAFMYVIINFVLSINLFNVIFLKEQVGFSPNIMSIAPVITGLLNMSLSMFLVPVLKEIKELRIMAVAFIILICGTFVFLLIPHGNVYVYIISILLTASGNFLVVIYRDASFFNSLGENEKIDVFSAVQTLSAIICIPSGYIAGILYKASPYLPFIGSIILFTFGFLLSLVLLHKRKQAEKLLGNTDGASFGT